MKRRPLPTAPIVPVPSKLNGNGRMNGHDRSDGVAYNGKGMNHGTGNGHHAQLPVPRHRSATMDWLDQMSETWKGTRRFGEPAYKDYFPEMVFQLKLLGADERMIANACNVQPVTVERWIRDIPPFSEAIRRGGSIADSRVAESLYHRAIGYSHDDVKIVVSKDEGIVAVPIVKHYPPDASAGIFWLTNRQKALWRNRITNEVTGPNGDALVPPQLIVQPVRTKE